MQTQTQTQPFPPPPTGPGTIAHSSRSSTPAAVQRIRSVTPSTAAALRPSPPAFGITTVTASAMPAQGLPRDDTLRANLMELSRQAGNLLNQFPPTRTNGHEKGPMVNGMSQQQQNEQMVHYPAIPNVVVNADGSPHKQMAAYRGAVDPELMADYSQLGLTVPVSILAAVNSVSREGSGSPLGKEKRVPPPLDLCRAGKYDTFRNLRYAAGPPPPQQHPVHPGHMQHVPQHHPNESSSSLKYYSSSSSLPSPADSAFTTSPPITPASAQLGQIFTGYPGSSPLVTAPPITVPPSHPASDVNQELSSALAAAHMSHSPVHTHHPNPHAFSLAQFDDPDSAPPSGPVQQLNIFPSQPPPLDPSGGIAFPTSASGRHSPASFGSDSPYAQQTIPVNESEVDYLALMYPSPPPTAGQFGQALAQFVDPHWTVGMGDAGSNDPTFNQLQAGLDHFLSSQDASFYQNNAFGISLPGDAPNYPPPMPQGMPIPPSPGKRKLRRPSSAVSLGGGDRKVSTRGLRKVRSRKFSKTGGLEGDVKGGDLPPVPPLPHSLRPRNPAVSYSQTPSEDDDVDMSDDDGSSEQGEDAYDEADAELEAQQALLNIDLSDKYTELGGASAAGQRRFKCLMCGKTFPRKSAILSHVQMHLDIRPFACTWPGCKMKFVRNHDLGRHVRSRHTRQKPFVCECGQGFSRGDALSRHQQRNICIGGINNRS